MDWTELDRAVKAQRKLGHPVASHIHALNLPAKKCTLLLEGDDEDDDNEVYPVPRGGVYEDACHENDFGRVSGLLGRFSLCRGPWPHFFHSGESTGSEDVRTH